ncbi:MAG: hypothetical protein Q8R15_01780 [Candidatus Micrarchaeota archaeon]|nr:hypothetical protein [Candidatus Micrarchaeota archaeon]
MYTFILLSILFVLSIPALANAWKEFQKQKQNNEVDKTLPEVLIHIATLPPSADFHSILEEAATMKLPAALPFHHCKELIKKGCPVEIAVSTAFANFSPVAKKTGELLYSLYTSGNSLLPNLTEFGTEMSKQRELKESLKADASIQKYSILVSSAFLVPFIIALIYSVSSKAASILPTSTAVVSTEAIVLAINIYLILFSFISARFISRQFSTHFITFFSITGPVSLLVFNISLLLL